jgi:hypothetical protein
MKKFDKEMFIPPNENTINARNEIINKTIISFGIENNENVVHFGCGSRNKSFSKFISSYQVNYLGIDISESIVESCKKENENLSFDHISMQDFIDNMKDSLKKCEWSIIDGILDENLYGDHQYDWLDTIIRESLHFSENGVIIVVDGKKTLNDETYNPEFISAYISSMYNRFIVSRVNEYHWVICIYKYYI